MVVKVDEKVEVSHCKGESLEDEEGEGREAERHEGSEEDELVEVDHRPEYLG